MKSLKASTEHLRNKEHPESKSLTSAEKAVNRTASGNEDA
jgi:hypothetical protein